MNKEIFKDLQSVKGIKWLFYIILLTAGLTYGYWMTHSTIGMDDTAIERYFIEGWAPHVGRWTLFLLNIVFDFAHFTPYFMDVVGVLLLCLAAYLFCVLWYRVSAHKVSLLSLIAFSTIFITYPLIGEVYIYYLHNGISLSFCLMALTGLAWWEYLANRKWKQIIWMILFLSLAIGCYESFALVYLVLICGIYVVAIIKDTLVKRKVKVWAKDMVLAVLPLISAMIIRKIMYSLINMAVGLSTDARDMSSLGLWLVNNPFVIIKDLIHQFVVRYVVNGKYIFGIKIYVITLIVFVIASLIYAIMKKRWSLLLWSGLLVTVPWLLVVVEFAVTPYRASQAIMLFIALVWFVCYEFINCASRHKIYSMLRNVLIILLLVVVFRQGFEVHQYFYFDYMKDDYNKKFCRELAHELYSNYDVENKAVIFIGQREMPTAFREWVYDDVDSAPIVHYNYVDEYGYRIYDIACTDMIGWSTWAELGDGEYEIYRYMEMLGYTFNQPDAEVRQELLKKAIEESNYPIWPQEGSIMETDEYICIYLGKVSVDL